MALFLLAGPMGRGQGRGQFDARGGRLVVGGAVVGQWGPNYGSGQNKKKKNRKVKINTLVHIFSINYLLVPNFS